VYRIGPERELAAAFYRNVCIHWFVNRAIVELSLVAAAESGAAGDPINASLAEALRLRDLLKFEFFFAEKHEYEAELRVEVGIIEPAWRERGGTALHTLAERLAASGGLMADRVLRSFLEAYYVVADRLLARDGATVSDADLVQDCLVVGRQYQLQRRIVSGEAISAELFKTGIRLARNRGLLAGDAAELVQGRDALAAELHDQLRRLEILNRWERSHRLRREGDINRPARLGAPA
jgi:glycerol-3-phosphate O-acyltransferase